MSKVPNRSLLFLFFAILLVDPAMAGPRPNLERPALVAPIMVDSEVREQAWIFPDAAEENFLVESEPFLISVSQELSAARITSLRSKIVPPGLFSLRSLREEGFTVDFNELNLELLVQIPAETKRRITKNIVQRGIVPAGSVYGPAPASAYVNARVNQPFVYPADGQRSSRMPLLAGLDMVANVHSWALNSGATFTERDDYPWQRSDTAVVHDFEDKMLRFTVGDQQTSSAAYLSGRSIGGVGLTRVFGIQPQTTTQPVSRTELLLKRPSSIDVLVNGVVQNQMRLGAGPVNLQDFPLSSGFNNVALRITDDLGRTEIINLSLLYNPEALGKGVQLFSYNVGVPWVAAGADRHYDSSDVNFSFFHRAGLSDVFTGGVFGQGSKWQSLGGFEGFWMGDSGDATFTLAASRVAGNEPDIAGRVRLETLDSYQGKIKPWRFSLETEYKGWRFAPVGNPLAVNPYAWTLDGYSLFRSRQGIDVGFGASYKFHRAADTDRWEARSDISSIIAEDLRLSANYAYARDTMGSHRVFVSLTWIEKTGRNYVNASYDYPSKTARIDAAHNPKQAVDDIRFTAGVARSPDTNQASMQAEYAAQRALLRLDHQSNFSRTEVSGTRHITSAGLSTALVWAGSAVSVSRPISDSFVILPAKGSAKGQEVLVNPQGDSAETYAGGFLPGVLPNVNSYYYVPISLDTSTMPPGMNVPEEYFNVKSTYRSGIEVPIGGDLSATAVGFLKLGDGTPITLASGEVVPEGAASGATFFTNRKGQFVAENLKPGRYSLRFYEGNFSPLEIVVPEGAFGLLRLGDLIVSKGEGE